MHIQRCGRTFGKLAHRMLLAGGDDEILRLLLLQHEPLRSHVVARMSPVAQRIEVAEDTGLLQPGWIRASPRVILRVTKVSPRTGDSWLKRMPLQANRP